MWRIRPRAIRSPSRPNSARVMLSLGGGSSVVVSRAALDSVGLFDESLSMVADWEMWHRLAHRYECAIVAEPLVGYAVHAASMTKHYCDVPASVRLCSYLNWIATSDAEQHRLRGAVLRARVACRQRSISGMMRAVRLLVLPPRSRGWRVVTQLRGNKQIEVPVWLQSTA